MAAKSMKARKGGNENVVLERFLIQLSVDHTLRRRYSGASKREKRAMLANEFSIGDGTIEALLDRDPGAVRQRLSVSDQQGFESVKGTSARKSTRKRSKK